MNKNYVTYIDDGPINSIRGIMSINEDLLPYALDRDPVLSGIEVSYRHEYTQKDYYIDNGTITLKSELPTYIIPANIGGVTTISGNYVDIVTVSGIPVGSTAYVYDGYFEEGSRYNVGFTEFENVDDGEFTTAFDVVGFYTIGVVTTAPEYKNTFHHIEVI